jgi:hypothetical protein
MRFPGLFIHSGNKGKAYTEGFNQQFCEDAKIFHTGHPCGVLDHGGKHFSRFHVINNTADAKYNNGAF